MDSTNEQAFNVEINELCNKYDIKLLSGIYYSFQEGHRDGVFIASCVAGSSDSIKVVSSIAADMYRVFEDYESVVYKLPVSSP